MIKIDDKVNCTGCEACSHICPKTCITMVYDEEGFKYPEVDESKCIKCNACVQVCPIINKPSSDYSEAKVYGMYNKNKKILKTSSSGGVFYELAREVINTGGVAYGVNYDYIFQRVDSIQDLNVLQGSKYIQAHENLYDEVKKDLISGVNVLYSGTPCQIAGLKKYLKKDYKNLLTVSFVCEGVPSKRVFDSFVGHYAKKYKSNVSKVKFRNKKYGWAYSNYFILQLSNKKNIEILGEENVFVKMFLSLTIMRPSCYSCKFRGTDGVSDIIMSDFWEVRKSMNTKYNFYGISQVLFNNAGSKKFDIIKEKFEYFTSSLEEMKKLSPMFNARTDEVDDRNIFFEKIKGKNNEDVYKIMNTYYRASSNLSRLIYKIKLYLIKIKYAFRK